MEEVNIGVNRNVGRSLHEFLTELDNYAGDTEQGEYAVYVLDCVQPTKNDAEMKKRLFERHDSWSDVREEAKKFSEGSSYDVDIWIENIAWKSGKRVSHTYPDYFDVAVFADETKYVGQTGDLSQRVRQHLIGEGTTFTSLFTPHRLSHVEWVDTREEAKRRESKIHDEINNIPEAVRGYASHMMGLVDNARSPEDTTYIDGLGPVDTVLIRAHGLESASDKEIKQTIEEAAYDMSEEEIEKIKKERTLTFAAGGK